MCYPTNKPCYSPPPRRAEPSTGQKERKRQRQRLRCGLALHSQSLFARSDSLLCAMIGWRAVQSWVRWLLRLEASLERMQGRSEACCYCYHRGLLQERGPGRESPAVRMEPAGKKHECLGTEEVAEKNLGD